MTFTSDQHPGQKNSSPNMDLSSPMCYKWCDTFGIKFLFSSSSNVFFPPNIENRGSFVYRVRSHSSLLRLFCSFFLQNLIEIYCMPSNCGKGLFLATSPVKFARRKRRRIVMTLALTPIFVHSFF